MNGAINFESLADSFSMEMNGGTPIARCDQLEVRNNEIRLLENTNYTHPRNPKELWERAVREEEVRENVKKMWGSYAVLQWVRATRPNEIPPIEEQGMKIIYVLRIPPLENSPKLARALKLLVNEIDRFRNGAVESVRFEEQPLP